MRKTILPILLAIFCFAGKSFGQIGVIADRAFMLDTLRTHSFSTGLSFLFYISDSEIKDYTNMRFHNSGHFNYLFKETDLELSLRQLVERKDNGDWISNHLIFLDAGIRQYKTIDSHTAVLRKLYPEAIAVYQDNTDRGLRRRFQVGAMLHPWGLYRHKFNLNFGVGLVYDWSSWEVNDRKVIETLSPELKNKIEFINARVKLRKNMYQDHNELRPVIYITVDYHLNDIISTRLSTAYQQSLKSPYSKEIKAAYPDLKKVYPYLLGQLDVTVKLHKQLALSISATLDYENNNLSLYKSSWSYSTLVGFSWTFTNQNPRMEQ